MEGRGRWFGALLLAVVLTFGASACGDEDEKTTAVETVTETTEETTGGDLVGNYEAAREVLLEVIDRAIAEPDYATKGFRSDPNLTASLVAKVEQLQLPGGGIDFQPFLCAQNIPRSVHYELARNGGEEMTINGIFDFGPGEPTAVTYEMVLEGDAWKLDSDDCIEQALAAG